MVTDSILRQCRLLTAGRLQLTALKAGRIVAAGLQPCPVSGHLVHDLMAGVLSEPRTVATRHRHHPSGGGAQRKTRWATSARSLSASSTDPAPRGRSKTSTPS